MSQFRKPVSELTIQDNFMFCKVMENPLICQEMLENLLGDKIPYDDKTYKIFYNASVWKFENNKKSGHFWNM